MTTSAPAPDLPTQLLGLARATAEEAALLVGAGRSSAAHQVDTKSSPVDVVTAVDTASEELIVRRLLERDATRSEAPVILDRYANTSSAGSIIAFHKYQDDMPSGSHGVICSFGAGYSIGCVVVRKK